MCCSTVNLRPYTRISYVRRTKGSLCGVKRPGRYSPVPRCRTSEAVAPRLCSSEHCLVLNGTKKMLFIPLHAIVIITIATTQYALHIPEQTTPVGRRTCSYSTYEGTRCGKFLIRGSQTVSEITASCDGCTQRRLSVHLSPCYLVAIPFKATR
jgi:hypothetical protein